MFTLTVKGRGPLICRYKAYFKTIVTLYLSPAKDCSVIPNGHLLTKDHRNTETELAGSPIRLVAKLQLICVS